MSQKNRTGPLNRDCVDWMMCDDLSNNSAFKDVTDCFGENKICFLRVEEPPTQFETIRQLKLLTVFRLVGSQ